MALKKAAPFGFNNSMADALIFLQMIEYLELNQIEGAYFISWNHDFFPKKKDLESNLKELLLKVKGRFFSALAYAMNSIGKEIVTAEELKAIELKKLEVEEWVDKDHGCLACEYYRSRWSPIHFDQEQPIIDERDPYDPNQLNLFKLAKEPIRHSNTSLKAGSCGYCGAVHIKCPDCDTVMDFPDSFTYNEVNSCPDCDMKFIFRLQYDRKGEVEASGFVIVDDVQQCAGCSNTFKPRGGGSDLCLECEKRYGTDH